MLVFARTTRFTKKNDWKENANGEDYKEGALRHATGVRGVGRDIFRRVDDRVGDAVGKV